MGLFGGKKAARRAAAARSACPNCGSTNVQVINGAPMDFSSPLLPSVLGQTSDWMNLLQCRDCGYQWQEWE